MQSTILIMAHMTKEPFAVAVWPLVVLGVVVVNDCLHLIPHNAAALAALGIIVAGYLIYVRVRNPTCCCCCCFELGARSCLPVAGMSSHLAETWLGMHRCAWHRYADSWASIASQSATIVLTPAGGTSSLSPPTHLVAPRCTCGAMTSD